MAEPEQKILKLKHEEKEIFVVTVGLPIADKIESDSQFAADYFKAISGTDVSGHIEKPATVETAADTLGAEILEDDLPDEVEDNAGWKWTHEHTVALIRLRCEMEKLFTCPPCTKKKLWNKLAKRLQSIYPKAPNGDVCNKKWANLLKTYRKIKEQSGTSTRNRENWQYYQIMEQNVKYKSAAEFQSEFSYTEKLLDLSDDSSSSSSESPSPSPTPTSHSQIAAEPTTSLLREKVSSSKSSFLSLKSRKRMRDLESGPPHWFKSYVQHKEQERRLKAIKQEPPKWFLNYLANKKEEKKIKEAKRELERAEDKKREIERIETLKRFTDAVLGLGLR